MRTFLIVILGLITAIGFLVWFEHQIERIVAAAGVVAPVDRRQATLF
ncbi:hypothetical protein [Ottowia oryzae]|nr:hypothetical protein [Ottowia oryzae]